MKINHGLPEEYVSRMKEMLGEREFKLYMESLDEEQSRGLRVNTGKIDPVDFKRLLGWELTPVPWTRDGFYYKGQVHPAKDPYYYAGLLYLQEPSAMAPAQFLPVDPGDRVLDLCAAPGGKSTQLGGKLRGKGVLVANDISNSRAMGLLKNLELWGISNCCVTSEDPSRLADAYGEYFDKILVDAPCSGEGMFRKDPDMVKWYGKRGPETYAPLQKTIVEAAARMLRPGGMMIYSTCTFSVREDEDIIRDLLETHEELEPLRLPLFEGALEGGIPGTIRLYPHRIRGEGHFIAMLKKKGSVRFFGSGENEWTDWGIPAGLRKFLPLIHKEFDPSRVMVKGAGSPRAGSENGMVYYLPENFELKKGLRYLRTGLLLGELKNGRFEPGQALAMALRPEEFACAISWPREDERVIRYLKGETISLSQGEEVKGWSLICVDGFSLGFAKGNGSNLKNKYYPGWRWQ